LEVGSTGGAEETLAEYSVTIPGEILAPAYGLRLRIEGPVVSQTAAVATLRNWRPGDRVKLRHSGGERKVKEVLERMRVTGSRRARWPVLEVDGRIVWMQGVELEPQGGIEVAARLGRTI
jgi:tRNA(Ile)-lysidine synthase